MSRELEGAMVSLPNALPQCSTGEGSLIGELARCMAFICHAVHVKAVAAHATFMPQTK